MDVPIQDEGMDHQEMAPLKGGIIGEAHWEVVSPEEIQASLEGISPPMMKMTMIIMVMEVMMEAPQEVSPATIATEKATWHQVGPFLARIRAKPWLYAVDVREDTEHKHACIEDKVEEVPDNPDNDEEVQAYEGTTEVAPENTESAEPSEFVNTFETYSEVDKEDEPVVYFGTMDPKDKPLEEEVIYCTSICAEVQEGQVPSEGNAPMQEDDPLIQDSLGNDVP
ncbi:hypothetical protein M404DRAFT_33366 [Pisolithus tinctorius Marx 270]|uniref:Uncharacterized protein n=1 Tax=Pisolithus tinctorius Marx 270 TaxID=870435 RepID=A0A0C3NL92_PISTI|nr:hypothetical protein M404DRAFT_33366 [Pisolithus tinctorius Marx 270]